MTPSLIRTAARRLANAFIAYFGTSIVLFGASLFGLAALIQARREHAMATIDQIEAMPDFETSLETADDPRDARNNVSIAPTTGSPPTLPEIDPPVAGDTISLLPDHIIIPVIGVDAPVVEVGWEARIVNDGQLGNVWQTADYAAGYHRQSAPIGRVGNTVISGHNNIKGAVFKDLYDLKAGDPIFLYSGDRTWAYVVTNKFVVREEGASPERRTKNARWIDPTPDERLTLVSCYPQWANTHRVVVVARPNMAAAAQVGSTGPVGSVPR